MIDRFGSLVEELKERRATRFFVGYLVGAWIAAQVVGFFVEQGYVGRGFLDVTLFLLVVFFFVTLVLVWYHGERGHQRVQPIEGALIALLLLVATGGSAWIATLDRGPGPRTGAVLDLGESSVAVLPFQNQILSSEYEWLDRGIADLLATDLSQFDTLRVVSGQRLFDLMRQLGVEGARTVPEDMQTEVTERSGARYMLTGSIIGSPDNLQIVATLSDVRSGDIRASSRARGDDVFTLVDEISAAISSDLLGRTISPLEATPVAQLMTNSLEAYREYDAGRDALWGFLNVEARRHFERAIELDSTFARAHFQLAGLLVRGGDYATASGHLVTASRHLGTASERDRLSVGASVEFVLGRPDEGERKITELLEKYPDEKDARMVYAGFLNGQLGRPEEGERLLLEVLELDPFFGEAWNLLAYQYARRGDFEGADTLVQRYVDLLPGRPNPLDSRGEILEMAGRIDEARSFYRQALEMRADFAIALGHLARTYVSDGSYAEARSELAAYRGSEAADTRVWATWLTLDTYLWEGDVETALAASDSLLATAAAARPDLYAQALDGTIRMLILLERYELAAELADELAEVRGPDGTTAAARMHLLGSRGDFEGMELERRRRLEAMGISGQPDLFTRAGDAGAEVMISHYRGEHANAAERIRAFNATSSLPLVEYGYPGIRSALAVGDAELARSGVERMMFVVLAPELHRSPLEIKYREYFRARIAEIEGDAAEALSGYESLLELWPTGVDRVPLFADVRARRDALAASSGS